MANQRNISSAGFTLLEILIAIFIFTIVISTIFGSVAAVFSSSEAVTQDMETYEMAKNCLSRIIIDLKSIYISMPPEYIKPDVKNDTPNAYRLVGDVGYAGGTNFGRLRFTSFAHVMLEQSIQDGIAEIVYYVQQTEEPDGREIYVLRRADSLYPYDRFDGNTFETKGTDPILCENIRSLEFTFYDEENTEYDEWDSESDEFKYATPRAVNIKLEIGDDSASILFETMISFPIYRAEIE